MRLADRAKRVNLRLPVEIRGQDAAGVPFIESTTTLNVSSGGICFGSEHAVEIGARLLVAIRLPPALRRHFDGRAVYRTESIVCRAQKLEGQAAYQVGARFVQESGG
jgi:PilZ domain